MSDADHLAATRLAATRAVYDHSAEQYVDVVGTTVSAEFEAPLDRAVLDEFAETVARSGARTVLDAGCGPGRIAAYLAARGLDARGVDVSTAMIAAAREAHPNLRFDEGCLTDLPMPDGSARAVVYWYSIINTSPCDLHHVWVELDRVLDDDGSALVAFQAGEGDMVTRTDAYGSSATLTLYRHAVDDVCDSLRGCGFEIRSEVRRGAELAHETTPQAFVNVGRAPTEMLFFGG